MLNGARVVGPAVAGLTIGAFGIAAAFAINGLSFLAVMIGLSRMRDDELHLTARIPRPRSVAEVGSNLAEGLRFVRDTPIVLMAIVVVGLVSTLGMNFSVLVPPLTAGILNSDAAGYGFLMTATGVGALAAAVALVAGGRPRPVWIGAGAVVLGGASVALAASTSFPLSMLLLVPVGAGGIAMAATANAAIQVAVPDGLRGRVMSVYTTVFSASMPVGGIAMGALASVVGIPITLAVGGVLSLVVGGLALVWYGRIRSARRRPMADAQSTAPNTRAAFRPPKPNEVLSTRR
jgi:MFS family permease